jgi:hypothetical protein
VDARVRDQVGLELVEIHIESTVETKAGSYGADNLGNQTVQMLVVWTRDVQVAAANVIDGLIVDQEGTI